MKTFAVLAVFVCFCWSFADSQSTAGPISTSKASPTQALNSHNEYRKLQNASDMTMLSWDDKLAAEAQTHAEKCTYEHDQTIDVGENIFVRVGGPPETYLAAITSWYNEIKDYDYAIGACAAVCGHYTQVVWAKSEKLGCGAAHCPTIAINAATIWNDAELVVCRYSPAGNFVGQKPFTKGTPCTNCPTGWSCNEELCQDPSTVSSTESTTSTAASTSSTTQSTSTTTTTTQGQESTTTTVAPSTTATSEETTASTSSTTQSTSTSTTTVGQESTTTTAGASSPTNSGTMSTSESTTTGSSTIPTTTETTNICALTPNRTPFLHPDDTGKCVHRFFQCANGVLIHQTCGEFTWFNPAFGVCDWDYNIPACMTTAATTTATTKSETDTTTTKFATNTPVFTTSQGGGGGTPTSSTTIRTTATTETGTGTTPTGSTTSTPLNGCSAEKAALLREYREALENWKTSFERWTKDFESGTYC